MKSIVLISCASKKLSRRAKAKDMYISPFFKYNLKYAQSSNPDKIFILSAKYGLLSLEKVIEPYEKTLNTMSANEIKEWASGVIFKLRKVADLEKDMFTLLAGINYRKYLLPHIKRFKIPLKGVTIGEQLKYLKQKVQT